MEIRTMRAFVAVVEDQSLSAAARRMHLSQPALSQTMNALEREFGVQLLNRGRSGVRPTEAGTTLLTEARAVLARYERALTAMAAHTASAGTVLRIGIPLELPTDLLSNALLDVVGAHPGTRIQAQHLSTTAQLAELRRNGLDLALVRERPVGNEFDAMLVVEEHLGVLLAAERAAELGKEEGVRLDALQGLEWVGFPRSGSPAWYDELTAVLRTHGIDPGPVVPDGRTLIAEVKLAAVSADRAFALAPPDWSQPLPETVTWLPLVGRPLTRRTWAVWDAASHRRDLAHLVSVLNQPAG
jgi:DNA-binding transcriptional LysR family regulator